MDVGHVACREGGLAPAIALALRHEGVWCRPAARVRPDVDDAVVGAPASTQLEVHATLDVHEDEPAGETHRNNDELRPELPLEGATAHLLGGPLDEDAQRPDDARDGDRMEEDGAKHLTTLDGIHVQSLPLQTGHNGQIQWATLDARWRSCPVAATANRPQRPNTVSNVRRSMAFMSSRCHCKQATTVKYSEQR